MRQGKKGKDLSLFLKPNRQLTNMFVKDWGNLKSDVSLRAL